MNNYEKNKLIEISYLEEIITFIENQLELDTKGLKDNRSKLIKSRKEMWENAPKSSDDFDKIPEMNNYLAEITYQTQNYEYTSKQIKKYNDMLDSPYFGRFDFKEDGYKDTENIYIGIHSLMEDNAASMLVYDWRTPIASLYYQFDLGRGSYESPVGTLSGDISLKRQYKVADGKLEYFFDSSTSIKNDILQEVLDKNTTSKMKNIVETIQREQDLIIRDTKSQLLIVQGVAGSGKTSIALHRIAFLLYQGIGSTFHSNNIMIISPSSIFSKYISNVLPELGEENVEETTFDNVISDIIKTSYNIETRNQMLEHLISNQTIKSAELEQASLVFKSSIIFKTILDRFIKGQKNIENIIKSYKTLFTNKDLFFSLSGDLKLPKNIDKIIDYTAENFNNQIILYQDASPLAYLSLKLNKDYSLPLIKHLVIDEAQDYYPLQYEILNMIFPNSSFTILGDYNQSLEKNATSNIYDNIQAIFNKDKMVKMTLNTSYRSSYEINKFSKKYLTNSDDHKSFGRHGNEPEIIYKDNLDDLHNTISLNIDHFLSKDYEKIAVICKSQKEKETLDKVLGEKASIVPAYLAKGLEYDVVLIYNASRAAKKTLLDKNLLYIAATRALHELKVFNLH